MVNYCHLFCPCLYGCRPYLNNMSTHVFFFSRLCPASHFRIPTFVLNTLIWTLLFVLTIYLLIPCFF